MLYFLCEWLRDNLHVKVPQVFFYTSTRMLVAALTALFVVLFISPLFIAWLKRSQVKQIIRKDECPTLGGLHESKQETPTMGGVLILLGMLISLFLYMDLTSPFTKILALTTSVLGILGGVDDYLKLYYKNTKGLKGRYKLFVQLILSLLVISYISVLDSQSMEKIYLPFFKEPYLLPSILVAFLMLFVIIGTSNAVNLTDGLDGLAAGTVIMVAFCFLLIAFVSNHFAVSQYLNIAYIEGSGEIAIYLSALVGACLGFLWYNTYPAEIFMGDTGSLALGGVLGVSAVLLKREFLLAIVGGIFVLEVLSVIIQVMSFRYRNKKRVFLCSPLHHHFEYAGIKEPKIVVRFWIIGFVLSVLGILSLKFQ